MFCFVVWVIVVLDFLVVWCGYGYLVDVGWLVVGLVLVAVAVGVVLV